MIAGWFHLVGNIYCVRLKIINMENMMPPIEQNMPHFNKEKDKQDKLANTPNKRAIKIRIFPLPNLMLFYLTYYRLKESSLA